MRCTFVSPLPWTHLASTAGDWRDHFLKLFAALLLAWGFHSRASRAGLWTQEHSSQAKSFSWQWDCYSRLLLAVRLATITPDFKQRQLILPEVDEGPWTWTVLQQFRQRPTPHLVVVIRTCTSSQRLSQQLWGKIYTWPFSAIIAFPTVLVTSDLSVDW